MADIRRVKLTVEYGGTNYAGWQIQPNGDTIQAELEKALVGVTGESIRVHGAGRTDAGVHALGQVAHFDTQSTVPDESFALALNTYLPEDIRVTASESVPMDFHARFSAKGKVYAYHIFNRNTASAVYRNTTCSVKRPLDVSAMKKAAGYFLGEHDFSAFCAANTTVEDKVRTIYSLNVQDELPLITITVEGNGFLYNMVRIIAGTLVDAGLGKLKPEQIEEILQSKQREQASATLPACGLILKEVKY